MTSSPWISLRVKRLEAERANVLRRLADKREQFAALETNKFKTKVEQRLEDNILEAKAKEALSPQNKKVNRFAEMDGETPEVFQKKIDDYHKQQKVKEEQSSLDSFRRLLQSQLPQRLPHKGAQASIDAATRDRLKRRTEDLYEPISKERNKELLEQLESGTKRMDSKLDDRTTNQVFGEYVEKYREFMAELAERSAARAAQARTSEEVERLLGAALSKLMILNSRCALFR